MEGLNGRSHFMRDVILQFFCQGFYLIWLISPLLWFCTAEVFCSASVRDYWTNDRLSATHAIVIYIMLIHVVMWFLYNHFHYLRRVRYAIPYNPRGIWNNTREGRERRGKLWYFIMCSRMIQCASFFYVFHLLSTYMEFWGTTYFLLNMVPFFTDVIILCNEICG